MILCDGNYGLGVYGMDSLKWQDGDVIEFIIVCV